MANLERGRRFDIDEIQEADRAARRVVQHDEEIFGVHQRADDRVDAAQHVQHVTLGAGEVGDREQRALQVFRTLELLVRILQFGPLQRPPQVLAGQLQRHLQFREETCIGMRGLQLQQQHGRLGLRAQPDRHALAVRMPVRSIPLADGSQPGTVGRRERRRRQAGPGRHAVQPPQHAGRDTARPGLGQRSDRLGHLLRRMRNDQPGQPAQLQRSVARRRLNSIGMLHRWSSPRTRARQRRLAGILPKGARHWHRAVLSLPPCGRTRNTDRLPDCTDRPGGHRPSP